MAISVISVILVLGGLIFFHELGHFLLARLFKVGVKTFSLGFGPRLCGFRRGLTDYRLSAIPLGGFVQLAGQDPMEETPPEFGQETLFFRRPAWQRILVVAAGPVFNLLLAWLIYWGLFSFYGQIEFLPVVGQLQSGSAAELAGVAPGDTILAINGQNVPYWGDLVERVRASQGEPLTLKIKRGSEDLEITLTPKVQIIKNIFGEEERVPMLGITSSGTSTTIPLDTKDSALVGVKHTLKVIQTTFQGIVKIIERVVPLDSIGGPIMIFQLVGKQAQSGLAEVLGLTAVLSINLGLLNLLPIPVLDGGHILFYGLEIVARRPLAVKWQMLATKIGLAMLLGLMALAVYNDITRIVLQ